MNDQNAGLDGPSLACIAMELVVPWHPLSSRVVAVRSAEVSLRFSPRQNMVQINITAKIFNKFNSALKCHGTVACAGEVSPSLVSSFGSSASSALWVVTSITQRPGGLVGKKTCPYRSSERRARLHTETPVRTGTRIRRPSDRDRKLTQGTASEGFLLVCSNLMSMEAEILQRDHVTYHCSLTTK